MIVFLGQELTFDILLAVDEIVTISTKQNKIVYRCSQILYVKWHYVVDVMVPVARFLLPASLAGRTVSFVYEF